jgi:hypothetical protein
MMVLTRTKTCGACRALHAMLLGQPKDEFEDPQPEAVRHIVSSTSLQLGLLACAAEVVQFAVSGDPSFPELTEGRLDLLGCVLDMWEGLAHVRAVLQQASFLGLPCMRSNLSPCHVAASCACMRCAQSIRYALCTNPLLKRMAHAAG